MSLTDKEQGYMMFLAFVLAPLGAWFGLGSPTDHASLALLGSGFISGVIAFIKETLGSTSKSVSVSV